MSKSWTGADPAEAQRMTPEQRVADIRRVLSVVTDPEIPVLTIDDLGILRGVEVRGDGHVVVTITPTYSGCPAMQTITDDVLLVLAAAGYADASVRTELSPAWTTDWMSEDGKRKLREYGIAPPTGKAAKPRDGLVSVGISVRCPRCGSDGTRRISSFGATPCQAPFVCEDCAEPFDKFKEI